jgi:alkanesulfonate monooxygenase SsuD/methylene tetrahydromethanopterin reductase-like flavin-dependent oxidoreductase (luciferase family)
VEIGCALPQFGFSFPGQAPLRWDRVVEHARAAVAAGCTSLWFADHLFWSLEAYGGPPDLWPCLDPMVSLAALAVAVDDPAVRIGTLVAAAGLRPPGVLTKAIVTVDRVSAGRFIAGVGTGWFEPEYERAGVPFGTPGERLARLEDTIAVLRGLASGGPFRFAGRTAHVDVEWARPPAAQQPAPPIWIGGKGDRVLDLVAREGDGWNTSWSTGIAAYPTRLDAFHRACDRHGRDPASVVRSACVYALVGEDEHDVDARWQRLVEGTPSGVLEGMTLDDWREGRIVGTVEQAAEQLRRWGALGVQHMIVSTGAVPFSVVDTDGVGLVAAACTLADQ